MCQYSNSAEPCLLPASPASSLGPSIIPDRHMYLFFSPLHFSFSSLGPPSQPLEPPEQALESTLLCWLQLHASST